MANDTFNHLPPELRAWGSRWKKYTIFQTVLQIAAVVGIVLVEWVEIGLTDRQETRVMLGLLLISIVSTNHLTVLFFEFLKAMEEIEKRFQNSQE